MFVVPGVKGSVPYLTPDQANCILEPSERILSIAALDAADFVEPCKTAGVSVANFSGLKGYHILLGIRSSFYGLHASAPALETGVAGSTEKGRSTLTTEKWEEMVSVLRPAAAVAMFDSLAVFEPSRKKQKTAQVRTERWASLTAPERYNVVFPVGVATLSSVTTLEFVDVAPRNESTLDYYQALLFIRERTPTSTGLFCFAYSLPQVVAALAASVAYVESPLPWTQAEKGIALILPHKTQDLSDIATGLQIDLHDDVFKSDIASLSKECNCYTCARHNRAYIHHLLTVQEMNSVILLSIHNLYSLVHLFRLCRSLSAKQKDEYLKMLLQRYL